MEDVLVKVNVEQEEGSFYQHIGLGIEEEACEVLHLEHSFIWC